MAASPGTVQKQHPDVDRLYLRQLLTERNNSIEQTEKFLTEQKNRATSHRAPSTARGTGAGGLSAAGGSGGGGVDQTGRSGTGVTLGDPGVPEMDGSFV